MLQHPHFTRPWRWARSVFCSFWSFVFGWTIPLSLVLWSYGLCPMWKHFVAGEWAKARTSYLYCTLLLLLESSIVHASLKVYITLLYSRYGHPTLALCPILATPVKMSWIRHWSAYVASIIITTGKWTFQTKITALSCIFIILFTCECKCGKREISEQNALDNLDQSKWKVQNAVKIVKMFSWSEEKRLHPQNKDNILNICALATDTHN